MEKQPQKAKQMLSYVQRVVRNRDINRLKKEFNLGLVDQYNENERIFQERCTQIGDTVQKRAVYFCAQLESKQLADEDLFFMLQFYQKSATNESEVFIFNDGLSKLIDYLTQLLESRAAPSATVQSFIKEILVLQILCALLHKTRESALGILKLLENPVVCDTILSALHPRHVELCYCIFEILALAAEFSDHGASNVLEALDYFQHQNESLYSLRSRLHILVLCIEQTKNLSLAYLSAQFLYRLAVSQKSKRYNEIARELKQLDLDKTLLELHTKIEDGKFFASDNSYERMLIDVYGNCSTINKSIHRLESFYYLRFEGKQQIYFSYSEWASFSKFSAEFIIFIRKSLFPLLGLHYEEPQPTAVDSEEEPSSLEQKKSLAHDLLCLEISDILAKFQGKPETSQYCEVIKLVVDASKNKDSEVVFQNITQQIQNGVISEVEFSAEQKKMQEQLLVLQEGAQIHQQELQYYQEEIASQKEQIRLLETSNLQQAPNNEQQSELKLALEKQQKIVQEQEKKIQELQKQKLEKNKQLVFKFSKQWATEKRLDTINSELNNCKNQLSKAEEGYAKTKNEVDSLNMQIEKNKQDYLIQINELEIIFKRRERELITEVQRLEGLVCQMREQIDTAKSASATQMNLQSTKNSENTQSLSTQINISTVQNNSAISPPPPLSMIQNGTAPPPPLIMMQNGTAPPPPLSMMQNGTAPPPPLSMLQNNGNSFAAPPALNQIGMPLPGASATQINLQSATNSENTQFISTQTNISTVQNNAVTSPPPLSMLQNGIASPPPLITMQNGTAPPPPLSMMQNGIAPPPPLTMMQNGIAPPPPLTMMQNGIAPPPPLTMMQNGIAPPPPLTMMQNGAAPPPPLTMMQNGIAPPPPLTMMQNGIAPPPPLTMMQNGAAPPPPLSMLQNNGASFAAPPAFNQIGMPPPLNMMQNNGASFAAPPALNQMGMPPPIAGSINGINLPAQQRIMDKIKKAPAMPMRQIPWEKLGSDKVRGSIWESINDEAVEIDLQTLHREYSSKSSSGAAGGQQQNAQISAQQATKKITNLTPSWLKNVSIIAGRIKLSYEEIKRCLFRLDATVLKGDLIDKLLNSIPPEEEIKKIQLYDGDRSELEAADLYLLSIIEVPAYESRLRATKFRLNIAIQAEEFRKIGQATYRFFTNIVKDEVLRAVLELTLAIGNYMNGTSFKGGANGFKITALNDLADIKSADKKKNLLMFVLESLEEKGVVVVPPNEDLGDLEVSSRVPIGQLNADLKELRVQQKHVKTALASQQQDNPEDLVSKQLSEFDCEVTSTLEELQTLVTNTQSAYASCTAYFCEDPTRITSDNFAQQLLKFKNLCKTNKQKLDQAKMLDSKKKIQFAK